MISINASVDLIIHITFYFPCVHEVLNVIAYVFQLYSIKTAFLFILVGIYSNIVLFQPVKRIKMRPVGAYLRRRELNRREKAKSRTYGM